MYKVLVRTPQAYTSGNRIIKKTRWLPAGYQVVHTRLKQIRNYKHGTTNGMLQPCVTLMQERREKRKE